MENSELASEVANYRSSANTNPGRAITLEEKLAMGVDLNKAQMRRLNSARKSKGLEKVSKSDTGNNKRKADCELDQTNKKKRTHSSR